MQRLKGMADGWSNRHSAAQWTPAASRAAAHWERRAGLWMKHWVCVCMYCEGLEGRCVHGGVGGGWDGGGGSKHAFSNLHMNIKKGPGLAKNVGRPYGLNKSCIPVFFYSFLQ